MSRKLLGAIEISDRAWMRLYCSVVSDMPDKSYVEEAPRSRSTEICLDGEAQAQQQ